MKIRRHSESHIVELDDGSTWRIFPGDIDVTLNWKPDTDLKLVHIDDEISRSHRHRREQAGERGQDNVEGWLAARLPILMHRPVRRDLARRRQPDRVHRRRISLPL